jgi:hypothetical protein
MDVDRSSLGRNCDPFWCHELQVTLFKVQALFVLGFCLYIAVWLVHKFNKTTGILRITPIEIGSVDFVHPNNVESCIGREAEHRPRNRTGVCGITAVRLWLKFSPSTETKSDIVVSGAFRECLNEDDVGKGIRKGLLKGDVLARVIWDIKVIDKFKKHWVCDSCYWAVNRKLKQGGCKWRRSFD